MSDNEGRQVEPIAPTRYARPSMNNSKQDGIEDHQPRQQPRGIPMILSLSPYCVGQSVFTVGFASAMPCSHIHAYQRMWGSMIKTQVISAASIPKTNRRKMRNLASSTR